MSTDRKAQSSNRQHGLGNISKKSPKSVTQTSHRHPRRSPPKYSMPIHDCCNVYKTKSCKVQTVHKNLRKTNKKKPKNMERDEHSISSPSKKDVFPHQQYLIQHSNSTLIDFSHPITHASDNTSHSGHTIDTIQTLCSRARHTPTTLLRSGTDDTSKHRRLDSKNHEG